MTRDEAVRRINDGIGFRPTGNPLEPTIVLRLQEAQRDLEKGKTLPRFLLIENYTFSLLAGSASVPLPPGFIRESDETRIRISIQYEITKPIFLSRRYFIDAFEAYREAGITMVPTVYIIRGATINFVNPPDRTYLMSMDYYKADDLLTSNIENKWLANAPEWLIGEAGWRLAMDLRDTDAVSLFEAIRKAGRAATFGEDIAAELASGPLSMGASL